MAEAASLPAILARRAAERPEEPWLFSPRGLDWRWLSWADVRDRVAAAVAAPASAPPDAAACDPDAVVAALAAGGDAADSAALTAAARLDAALPRPERRPILTAATPPATPAGRLLLAWTLHAGAVWALVPSPSDLVEDVLWTRPTVTAADAARRAALLARLGERRHRRWSRLATVLALDAAGDAERAAWAEGGVALVTLPEPGDAASR